jgi:biotin-(acetyl-CoA carboxylase) ligase
VLGREIDRVTFAARLLESLERRYARFRASDGRGIAREWRARSCSGLRARIIERGRVIEGIAEDIDEVGGLLVRKDDGSLVRTLEAELLPLTPG